MSSLHLMRLSDIIEILGEDKTNKFLANFHCSRDPDLKDYIQHKAISHEKRSISRTYVLVDENKGNQIVGYFSLALTSITISMESKVSNSLKKRMNIYNDKTTGYLIGQLCKNDGITEKLGKSMMDFSMNLIKEGMRTYGGKVICVDCKDNEKLIRWYESLGFTDIGMMNNRDFHRLAYVCDI